MSSLLRALLCCFCCLASQGASAQPAKRLSDRGRLLLGGSIGASWSSNERSAGLTRSPRWAAWVSPSALYFVRDRFALGGYAGYGLRHVQGEQLTRREHQVELGLQSAYELVLAERLGVLLLPQLGYQHRWREDQHFWYASSDPRQQVRSPLHSPDGRHRYDLLRTGLFAPLIIHLSESIGVGFGPYFYWDFYLRPRDARDRSRLHHLQGGVSSWIGGSF